jgi:hypothetical protein
MTTQESFNLQKFIISVVIIGVTLILGIYISDTIGNAVDNPNTPVSVANETGAWINSTTYVVDHYTKEDFAALTITALYNSTNISSPTVIGLGNITMIGTTGFKNATARLWNNVWVSYTYTYTAQTNASEAATEVVEALATGTSWISILVVVGFATIILTMLTSGLGGAVREQEVPYY